MLLIKDRLEIWGLFLLSPLFSLLYAIKNYRYSWAKNILWAFVTFYGFTFVISDTGMDANRYRDAFLVKANSNISFDQFFSSLYNPETKTVDILEPLVSYIVAIFTSDYRFLFAAFALLYGYFYSRNLWYVLDRVGEKANIWVILLILTFALTVPIWNINGFRFYTALHMYFFGIFPFLFEKKKGRLIISFLSVFAHFSFLIPVAVFLLYMILGNRTKIYFGFFIFSLFITELDLNIVKNAIPSEIPQVFQERTEGYTSEELVTEVQENPYSQKAWYARIYEKSLNWAITIFIVVIFLNGYSFITSRKYRALYSYTLFFLALANITSLVPSGGRFISLAHLFALSIIIIYAQHQEKKDMLKKMIPFSFPILILYILVKFRAGFDTMGVFTVIGNPLFAPFFSNEIALIDLFK